MKEENEGRPMGQVIKIDETRIRDHLGEMVRGTVEETLNAIVQVRDRGRAHPGTPKGFGDILHTPDRYTGQAHLDQRFLDRRFSAPVALDHGRLKDLLAPVPLPTVDERYQRREYQIGYRRTAV